MSNLYQGATSDMKVLSLGAGFMEPLLAPDAEIVKVREVDWKRTVEAHLDADFSYAMNMVPDLPGWVCEARDRASRSGVASVWASIEDPNSHTAFIEQAKHFDIIGTGDSRLVPAYKLRYPKATVLWLPLACQPAIHKPVVAGVRLTDHFPPESLADFVLIANYYSGEERLEQVRLVVEPVVDAGHSLALYSYGTFSWPTKYTVWRRGSCGYLDTAQHYPEGRVALGIANQMLGTTMTSMRIFEAMSCGKPVLAAYSPALAALGFVNGEHLLVSDTPDLTRSLAKILTAPSNTALRAGLAERGQRFVHERHTYRNRLETIMAAIRREEI